ncbi:MAG TPA: (Fe-S)-binding protein [Cyclobacteriaceae bacterium]|nr:(Fe-S)-binding protein [Cyclobacteriaceae bacterium]
MKIGLFIPCYIDQFYPRVGVATLRVLQQLGLEVGYPLNQTCCGQPMANAGYEKYGKDAGKLFVKNFSPYDYIVSPSGSCVMHVKEHLGLTETDPIHDKIFEFCEFLTDIVKVEKLDARFPYKVGLHASCHGLRGLRLAKASELNIQEFNKPKSLLKKVNGLQLIELSRRDECCGFGGTFAITEEAVSVRMGEDRIDDHLSHGAEVITGADMSCLMHLEGIIRRQKKNIKVMHIAEILMQPE